MTRDASPGQREAPTADGGADPVAADTAEATMTRVEPSPASATMRRVAPAATTEVPTTTTPPTSTTGPTPATGQSVAADRERPATAPRSPRPMTSAGAPTRPAGATPATGLPAALPLPAIDPGTWTVHPGDSLWSIAVEVVQTDAGEAAERAVSAYWRALVAENRSRLVDPDNPDLLLAGQRLVLPPTTGAAG